jgi:hypothetical protein
MSRVGIRKCAGSFDCVSRDYFLTCDIEHQAVDPISATNPSAALGMDMWSSLPPVSAW